MLKKGVVLACCLLAAAAAQESRPASAPASRPAVEYRTTSGLRVRLVPLAVPGERAVILGIHGAGFLAEPANIPHLAHVSEHALFHSLGEASPGGRLVAAWREKNLANAETLPELMYFDLFPPADVPLRAAIDIQHQRFVGGGSASPAVMEREIPLALGEVTQLEASRTDRFDFLGKFAWSAFTQAALRGVSAVPFKEKSAEISWAMVDQFRQRTFYPGSAMLTVLGDFDPEAARKEIPAEWVPKHREHQAEPRPKLRPGPVEAKWDVASHQLFLAWPAPPPSDPAHPALSVLANLLQPRLQFSKEVTKLTRQPVMPYADYAGMFVIQLPLNRAEDGTQAAAAVLGILEGLPKDPAAFRSLKGAKVGVRTLAGLPPGDIQYPAHLPRKLLLHANVELFRMRTTLACDQSPEDYCARTDKVTADDLKAAVKTWLPLDKATIVTVAGK